MGDVKRFIMDFDRSGESCEMTEDFDGDYVLATDYDALAQEVERLRAALAQCKISHNECEDGWYSCPMSADGCLDERETECNCGTADHNKFVDDTLAQCFPPKPEGGP